MKRGVSFVIVAALALALGGGAAAREPSRPSPEMMPMGRPMMGSMGSMHGGMMGPMPTTGASDPQQQAEALAMRGEMMRAMGEIMTKYAERMRQAK